MVRHDLDPRSIVDDYPICTYRLKKPITKGNYSFRINQAILRAFVTAMKFNSSSSAFDIIIKSTGNDSRVSSSAALMTSLHLKSVVTTSKSMSEDGELQSRKEPNRNQSASHL